MKASTGRTARILRGKSSGNNIVSERSGLQPRAGRLEVNKLEKNFFSHCRVFVYDTPNCWAIAIALLQLRMGIGRLLSPHTLAPEDKSDRPRTFANLDQWIKDCHHDTFSLFWSPIDPHFPLDFCFCARPFHGQLQDHSADRHYSSIERRTVPGSRTSVNHHG
jgi:hypothetical protein